MFEKNLTDILKLDLFLVRIHQNGRRTFQIIRSKIIYFFDQSKKELLYIAPDKHLSAHFFVHQDRWQNVALSTTAS